jgi:hypothetical protein
MRPVSSTNPVPARGRNILLYQNMPHGAMTTATIGR